MTTPAQPPGRSYGCSFGCGNPYDYIIVSVSDSSALFVCLPCYVRLASDMVAAMTDPESEKVKTALEQAGYVDTAPMSDDNVKSRGHNAPAGTDDPDLIQAFEDIITEEDLPSEFL